MWDQVVVRYKPNKTQVKHIVAGMFKQNFNKLCSRSNKSFRKYFTLLNSNF